MIAVGTKAASSFSTALVSSGMYAQLGSFTMGVNVPANVQGSTQALLFLDEGGSANFGTIWRTQKR
eukprot:8147084-Pyramimonas_sp.AAC.1